MEKDTPQSSLHFHTFYKEFSGDSAEDIILLLYEDSKAGTEFSFLEWWEYQKSIWLEKYNIIVPSSSDTANAYQELLAILLQVGALEEGKLPAKNNIDALKYGEISNG